MEFNCRWQTKQICQRFCSIALTLCNVLFLRLLKPKSFAYFLLRKKKHFPIECLWVEIAAFWMMYISLVSWKVTYLFLKRSLKVDAKILQQNQPCFTYSKKLYFPKFTHITYLHHLNCKQLLKIMVENMLQYIKTIQRTRWFYPLFTSHPRL